MKRPPRHTVLLACTLAALVGCDRSTATCPELPNCIDAAPRPDLRLPAEDLLSELADLAETTKDLAPQTPMWTSRAIEQPATCVWGSSADSVFVGLALGPVLHSIDRGKTWSKSPLGARFRCAMIWGPDRNNVFAIGHDDGGVGALWVTRDDGKSWQAVHGADVDRDILWAMSGRSNVLFLAGRNRVLRSSDLGRTWIVTGGRPAGKSDYHSIVTTEAGRTWVGEAFGYLSYTDNDGETWTAHSDFPSQARSVWLWSAGLRLYVMQGGQGPRRILRSDDGGRTFLDKSGMPIDLNYQMLSGFDERRLWFGGRDGLVYFTEDGGDQWKLLFPRDENRIFWGVWASGPADVYVVGGGVPGPGYIYHYE